MISIRKSDDRGGADLGWLQSKHTFSFGSYHDPKHMNFGPLRVINEDRVKPGAGFDSHGHKDMEILSYVLDGALEHKDNTGTGSVIRPGDIQRMSAGRGILHSEFNHSKENPVHFLQIWIEPDTKNIEPGYEQKNFAATENRNELNLVASPESGEHSVKIHQDASLYIGKLDEGTTITYNMSKARQVWMQVASGDVLVNDHTLKAGDGASIVNEVEIEIRSTSDSEILLFDLAAA